jgi:hypothetical protein
MANAVKQLDAAMQTEFAKFRANAAAEAIKALSGSLEAAKTEQLNAANAAEAATKSGDANKAEKGKFWQSLCLVCEEAKTKGIAPLYVVMAVNDALGNAENMPNTVKQYRISFAQVATVYLDDAKWRDAAPLADVKAETPLHLISYADARSVYSSSERSEDERVFRDTLDSFVRDVKAASKRQAPKKKEGIVELKAVPYAELTKFLADMRSRIPKRTIAGVEAEGEQSDPMADAVNEDDSGAVDATARAVNE